ncbi:peptidoglycan-binding protein [Brevibacterium picturae]|uniref:Peptidoglycan-binding protein n=1 Tax=Brevibacterium picturae TaxID=260553 RepID=A0ABP4N8B5_9MICO
MPPRHRARWVWPAVAGILVVALGVGAWWFRPWELLAASEAGATEEPVTTAVELTTLTSQMRLNAQLSYGDAVPLRAAGGTITTLPAAGTIVKTGQQVYETDGHPVVLFRGSRPFWRELSVDSDDGEDIRQLQQNLTDLGFYSGNVDGGFGWLTRQAVRDWQKSLGLPQTSVFSPSSVVVTDSPGIRIAQITARLGDSGASPATYTETTLRATAKLTAAQARELSVGTPVTVTLPDGTEIDTTLAAIDPGGQPTGEGDATTSPSATIEFPDQAGVAAAGAVAVRVVVKDDREQSPTLIVPVTALLATAGGGYAVEVYTGGEIVRTPVQVGLVADARAQILASGTDIDGGYGPVLAAGNLVVLAR